MKKNCHKRSNNLTPEERHEIVRAICKRYVNAIKRCGCNWRKLADFADKAYEDAVRAFDRKDYQQFELNLLLYSDVWLYARDHLRPKDFRYFCLGQFKPSVLAVQ